jgi:hypothetical protein
MLRSHALALVTLASALTTAAGAQGIPTACQLLTAQDAATLAGFPVTQDPDDASAGSCIYKKTGGSPTTIDGVEVTVRTYADAASAHAGYPTWVSPFPKPNPNIAKIPLPGVGDEATLIHITPSPAVAAIDFRSGAVLVKLGVYPPVSDSALATAARTMIKRL